MAPKRRIAIAKPSLGEDEWRALREPLESGWVTQGPRVAAFEERFAERHGVSHAIATTSCTTGLHLALEVLGIGPGDEVIVPALSWVATANVVLYCGATPVLVDVDTRTFNIDPAELASAVTAKTRAIIPVHLFGLCADIDAIAAAAPGVPLIEDAACAAGASYKGRPAGSLGRAGVFSFHPRKSITTGEGGMVTTSDAEFAEMVRVLRNHGASISEEQRHTGPKPYLLPEFSVLGFNYRMTDLQGAIGLVQLGKLDSMLAERAKWAAYYCRELSSLNWLTTPDVPDGYEHGWQAFVCMVDEARAPMPRDEIMEFLEARGVSTRPGTHAIHTLDLYRQRFGYVPENFRRAARCSELSIAIPLHNQMSADDYAYVVEALRAAS